MPDHHATEPDLTHETIPKPYTPPSLTLLGSLHDLTRGGAVGPDDGGAGFDELGGS
jgi:hypothetical protein